ncbi:MAG TPA: ATP-binding protein [Steroidobacteraceae bacterium]|nr:ATP-binding protein [Steroidobacteraceae bacterium]
MGASRFSIARLSPNNLIVLVVILGVSFVATVIVPGIELAGGLVESSAALKLVAEQQRYPTMIRATLETLRERLNNRGYIQESLDQLADATKKLDAALSNMAAPRTASWFGAGGDTGESIAGKHARALLEAWDRERAALNLVLNFHGVPYSDSETAGTALNDSGRQLEHDVTAAIRTSRHALGAVDDQLATIGSELQAGNAQSARHLRMIMMVGLLIAAGLVLLAVWLLRARLRQDANLKEARQQTLDILRTVKDGLFLLDENLIIGAAYSSALETLFQRKDIAGLHFEALLRDIVSAKTLATALKFVKVLWSERTNEKLVKSINPLGEVEVHLGTGGGKFDTRYLDFQFHRVRVDGKIASVLVSVSDVSSRVELARELQHSQQQAQAQVDTLLGILHIDPAHLASFLSDSNAAMKMINAVLKEPAREESMFRKKLDTLFRQAHSVKGEAAALGLSSIESRAHSFEEDLKALKEKPELSGNDFLPLVIKLDDLLTHLQSVGELVSRLAKLQAPRPDSARETHTQGAAHRQAVASTVGDSGLGASLQQLAERIAGENDKEVRVQCRGLELVPEDYRRLIKDVAIQAVRNAVVHGIEAPAARTSAGKRSQGVVRVEFKSIEEGGYKLVIEDDGQGLATERIKEAALQRGFITQEQAAALDAKQTLSLLFQPGFSTMENPTKDAGRGVGMNLMAELMRQAGGRVGVATAAGRFTRVTLTLPTPRKTADDTVAA